MTDQVTNQQFKVEWINRGGKASASADPAYPDGVDFSVARGAVNSCVATLPYPAEGVGTYVIECKICGFRAALTTAGRRDDPRSVEMPCKLGSRAQG